MKHSETTDDKSGEADLVATMRELDTQISELTTHISELSACMSEAADRFAEFDDSEQRLTQAKATVSTTAHSQPTAGD